MFATEFPEATEKWHRESNFIVVLQIPDLPRLRSRYQAMTSLERTIVIEPDIGNEPTAFACLGPAAGRLLSDLPLCQREVAMV